MDEQKQILRNYILDFTKTDLTLDKAIETKLLFENDSFPEHSITNTSITTLLDGKVLLVVVYTKD
tara:strand:- start:118 stop:312 length:195 start_codon:yes stop_codon:yes gene_type:complete